MDPGASGDPWFPNAAAVQSKMFGLCQMYGAARPCVARRNEPRQAKCPGLKREEINAALLSHSEELRADNARIEQVLKNVEKLFCGLPEGTDVEDAIRISAKQDDETAQVFVE